MIKSPPTSIGIQESHGEASYEGRQTDEMRDLEIGNRWRDMLVEQLSAEATRSFEMVFLDPSPQNVAVAIDRIGGDPVTRAQTVALLAGLTDNSFLSESSELSKTMQHIYASLRDYDERAPVPGDNSVSPSDLQGSPSDRRTT
jgi:hypothetical protein